ncbi:hypothetical protein ABK040_003436 [Willaertia magna]
MSSQLDLTINSKLNEKNNNEALIHVSVVPPMEGTRKPSTFICVLDISGSMGENADNSNDTGENHGFSRLDLVKHSVRTIINVLKPQDQLAIVSFTDNAAVELPLTHMTEEGRTQANTQLNSLTPQGCTNLWDGLRVGLEMASEPSCKSTNTVVVLLTDGEPNQNPPRGIIPTLRSHIDTNPLNCTIHTFGFGYNLDSALLNEISQIGSGSYAYIPDCSMVGTIFVNLLSNVLATVVKRAQLMIFPLLDNVKVEKVIGYNETVLNLGAIQYGQTKDFVLKVKSTNGFNHQHPFLSVSLKYVDDDNTTRDILREINDIQLKDLNELYVQYSRSLYIENLLECMTVMKQNNSHTNQAKRILEKTMKELLSLPSKEDKRITEGIVHDMESANENEGQVTKALSREDWFRKWGQHYLPSLIRAHSMQQCNNFKDPGVQFYGGKLFKELQNEADVIFCELPPPEATAKSSYSSYSYTQPVNMSSYYNVGGSCFNGDALVLLSNGLTKKVCEIRKGDKVKNKDGVEATIICVVKSKTVSDEVPMVELNGMKITPYHPVRWNGGWKFPIDIKEPEYIKLDYVYNFVMDSEHVVTINGIECITLGHGLVDDEVIKHEYFGTGKVLKDLELMEGWNNGFVFMEKYTIRRNPNNGLICSISQ